MQAYSLGIMTTNAILDFTDAGVLARSKDDVVSPNMETQDDDRWQAVAFQSTRISEKKE